MAGAALLVLAVFAIVAVLLAPDRPDDDDEPNRKIPAPRAEGETNPVPLPNAANEKENA